MLSKTQSNIHFKLYLSFALSCFAYTSTHAQSPPVKLLIKANVEFRNSRLDSADSLYDLCLSQAKITKDSSLIVYAYSQKAQLSLLKGELSETKKCIRACKQWVGVEGSMSDSVLAKYELTLGDFYLNVSDSYIALKHFRKSYYYTVKDKGPESFETALCLSRIARYHNFIINIDSAWYYTRAAWEIVERKKYKSYEYPIYQILEVYAYAYKIKFRIGELGYNNITNQSRMFFYKAKKYANEYHGKENAFIGDIIRNIGNTYTDQVLYNNRRGVSSDSYLKNGLRNYIEAINFTSKHFGEVNVDRSKAYYVSALILTYSGKKSEIENSLADYDSAMMALGVPVHLGVPISKSDIINCNFKYDLMVLINGKIAHLQNCHSSSGDEKYLLRADLLSSSALLVWGLLISEFESDFPNRLLNLYTQNIFNTMGSIYLKLYKSDQKRNYLEQLFLISERSKNSLKQRLIALSGNKQVANSSTVSLSNFQSKLKSQDLYLSNIGTKAMIAITSKDVFISEIKDEDSLGQYINRMNLGMTCRNTALFDTNANLLFQNIFKPVLSHFSPTKFNLILSLNDRFSTLPVNALTTEKSKEGTNFKELKYLLLNNMSGHVLSATSYVNSLSISMDTNQEMLGICPTFHHHANLPFSNMLIKNFSEKYQGQFLFNTNTCSLKDPIFQNEASILYLSTHALVDEKDILRSYLLFSDSLIEERRIYLDTLFSLKKSYDLVSLIACNTGQGTVEYGEGSLNFSKAFLYTGTKTTLSTLWSVDDKISSEISQMIFNEFKNRSSTYSALHLAQLKYLKTCTDPQLASPYYWAGIIVTGKDDIVFPEERSNRKNLLEILTVVLSIGLFYYFVKKKPAHQVDVPDKIKTDKKS